MDYIAPLLGLLAVVVVSRAQSKVPNQVANCTKTKKLKYNNEIQSREGLQIALKNNRKHSFHNLTEAFAELLLPTPRPQSCTQAAGRWA